MLPVKLFFWRSSILRDDMAEFWPQVGGSVPVSEFPLKSSVCSSGSVCLPPWPHLHPNHVTWHRGCLSIYPLSVHLQVWDGPANTSDCLAEAMPSWKNDSRQEHAHERLVLTRWGVSLSCCCSSR